MQKVKSTEELQVVQQLGDTIYLRKNIELVNVVGEQETHDEWQADEVSFELESADLQKIEQNFNLYWDWAEEKEQKEELKKDKERLVRELVDNYKLADMKKTLDQLVIDSL